VVEYPTTGGLTAFLNYYPPCNKDCTLPSAGSGQKPALLVGSSAAALRCASHQAG
jgi:hypothetical protein